MSISRAMEHTRRITCSPPPQEGGPADRVDINPGRPYR